MADPAQDVASNDDDSSSSDEEQAFHVPLDLGEGLLADIRKYLVETEDMDPNDAHLLEAAALEMAAELCRAAEEEEATPEVEQSACHDVEQAARPFQGPADRLRAAPLADSEPGSCLDGGGHVGANPLLGLRAERRRGEIFLCPSLRLLHACSATGQHPVAYFVRMLAAPPVTTPAVGVVRTTV